MGLAPLLYADNEPVSDATAYNEAIGLSLERTMRQARFLQQRYMVLPMSMADVVNRLFPTEVPEWSEGFCYAKGSHIPHDGKSAVICLLNKGHEGPCGGSEHLRHIHRDGMHLAHSPLYRAWSEDPEVDQLTELVGFNRIMGQNLRAGIRMDSGA